MSKDNALKGFRLLSKLDESQSVMMRGYKMYFTYNMIVNSLLDVCAMYTICDNKLIVFKTIDLKI